MTEWFKICTEIQNLETIKEGGLALPNFKTYYKSTVINTVVWNWGKDKQDINGLKQSKIHTNLFYILHI